MSDCPLLTTEEEKVNCFDDCPLFKFEETDGVCPFKCIPLHKKERMESIPLEFVYEEMPDEVAFSAVDLKEDYD